MKTNRANSLEDFEKQLAGQIPLADLMQIKILSLSPEELRLTLPLAVNHNHKGTLFGGSLYAASAYACYGLFLWGLRQGQIQTEDLVIAEGGIRYLRPVSTDPLILAQWPEEKMKTVFLETLKAKKKARIEMGAQIYSAGLLCAEFKGDFVAKIHDQIP